MKKKHIFIIVSLFCIFAIHIIFNFSIPNEYNRAMYTVIIYNDSNEILNDISIFYGRNIAEDDSVIEFDIISNLNIGEYRKINIPTHSPDSRAKVPYNVWVKAKYNNTTSTFPSGYFGIDTGGMAAFRVCKNGDKLNFIRLFHDDIEYKKIFRRHIKKQNETSWY